MEAPAVQYVTTGDGIRIAYTVCGNGPPVVVLNEPTTSHVELEWSQPVLRDMLERLAERTTLVRLDIRGTGLSDRVTMPGEDPVFSDVRAVVDRLGWKQYTLCGVNSLTPAAIIYAARYPQDVTHLVLLDPVLRVMDMVTSPQLTAIMTAARADWTIASEMIGFQVFGVGRAESRGFGAYIRSCVDPSFYGLALRTRDILDATAAASNVKAPTFLVRHAGHPYVSAEIVREMAATIPNASLVTVPGQYADNPVGLVDRVLAWLLP